MVWGWSHRNSDQTTFSNIDISKLLTSAENIIPLKVIQIHILVVAI